MKSSERALSVRQDMELSKGLAGKETSGSRGIVGMPRGWRGGGLSWVVLWDFCHWRLL